jgi:hypothetical protein
LIDQWVATLPLERLLRVDAAAADYGSHASIAAIAEAVLALAV